MTSSTERAILAGGCFWGMQDLIRKMPGVLSTRVGCSSPAPQRSPELQRSPPTEFSENGIGDGGQQAAPAGRAVDRAQGGAALVRASQWIKRRNAGPKLPEFRCRTLAMTP
jgi:hypothetical protein